jgi:uncharacterized protein (DUF1015 family)
MRPPRLLLVSSDLAAELAEVGYESLTPDNAARLRRLALDGAFAQPPEPSYVVYELAAGEHRQTGVVVEVAVDDYRHGLIQAHEGTNPNRVDRLGAVLDATRLELVPLTLAHEPCPELRSALAAASAGEPDVRVASDRVDQAAWIVRDPEIASVIGDALAKTPTLYIADGHHRIAAAEQYATAHGSGESRPSDFILGALFPWDEVRILGYHRCVTRPEGPAADVLAALAEQPAVESIEEVDTAEAAAPAPGRIAMHLDSRWYQIRLRPPPESAGPRESLDLAILESVLGPALGIADPASDARIEPVPGTVDPATLSARCAERHEIGFLLHPPTTDQVQAVSDAGQVMPAKSTWFDPKARTGPFLRDLS